MFKSLKLNAIIIMTVTWSGGIFSLKQDGLGLNPSAGNEG